MPSEHSETETETKPETEAELNARTFAVGKMGFEALFGEKAITEAKIEAAAEAALVLLLTPKPDYFDASAEDCEAYAAAMIEFGNVVTEELVLGLCYLALEHGKASVRAEKAEAERDASFERYKSLAEAIVSHTTLSATAWVDHVTGESELMLHDRPMLDVLYANAITTAFRMLCIETLRSKIARLTPPKAPSVERCGCAGTVGGPHPRCLVCNGSGRKGADNA